MSRQLHVACAPVTAFERRLARVPADLSTGEGWLRATAPNGGSDAGSGRQLGGRESAVSLLALPAPGGTGGGGNGDDDGGGASGHAPGCTEYNARLAEALYASASHALRFLASTCPDTTVREAADAGGAGWPRKVALAALQVRGRGRG